MFVCVCNGIGEKAFREAARRPEIKCHSDVLNAFGGQKICAADCTREGKRIIREEKARPLPSVGMR